MSETDDGVTILSDHECWELMAGVTLGRLVTSVDGQPEIFPVNYVVQHRTVLFRTAEGTKLVSTAINNHVLFEVDDHNVGEGWSVIVRGRARSLRTNEQTRGSRTRPAAAVDAVREDALRAGDSRAGHGPPVPVRPATAGRPRPRLSHLTSRRWRGRGMNSSDNNTSSAAGMW